MTEVGNFFIFPVASWLLTYSLHSTLLLGVILIIVRFVPFISPRIRILLLMVSLVGALLTATIQSAVSPVRYIVHTVPVSEMASDSEPVDTIGRRAIPGENGKEKLPQNAEVIASEKLILYDNDYIGFITATFIVTAWLGVIVVLGMKYAIKWRLFLRKINGCREIENGYLNHVMKDLSKKAGIQRKIRLFVSPRFDCLMAVGFSKIFIPESFLVELDPNEQRCILAHELAHILRLDTVRLVVMRLLEIILFFQPLNFYANRRLRVEAEYLADELALSLTSNPEILAKSLLKVAEAWRNYQLVPHSAGLLNDRPQLSNRMKKILEWRITESPKKSTFIVSIAILSLMCLFALIGPIYVINLPRLGTPEALRQMQAEQSSFQQGFSLGRIKLPKFRDITEKFADPNNDSGTRDYWVGNGWIKRVFKNGDRVNGDFYNLTLDRQTANIYRFNDGGGSLTVTRNEWQKNHRYKFVISSDAAGNIRKEYSLNGVYRQFDTEAEEILKKSLLELLDFVTKRNGMRRKATVAG